MRENDRALPGLFRDLQRNVIRGLGIGATFLLCVFSNPVRAALPTQISGEVFSEFYSVARHHDPAIQGQNGFWFRRIDLTFDNALSSNLSFRFKLEMSSSGNFKSNSLLVPFVKDAFINYRLKGQDFQVGLIATPTWENVESFWGYRALEKSPCDLQEFGSARDFGIALKGGLNSAGTVSYKVMFGNGEGYNAETNKGKKAYAQFVVRPRKGLLLDLYADTERHKDSRIYNLVQVFAGTEARWGRVGFLYARRSTRLDDSRDRWDLWSALAIIKAHPKAEVVLRFDRMADPNPLGSGISYIPFSDRAPSNLVIAGLGWKVSDAITVIPNVKHVFYDKLGDASGPSSDTYLNVSARLKF